MVEHEWTVQEAGRKGGTKVRDTLGLEYYSRIGKMGGNALKEKMGVDHYRELGRLGGATVKAMRGRTFFQEIGKLGGDATAKRGPEFFQTIGRMGGRPGRRAGVSPRAKLTVEDVQAIRNEVGKGEFHTVLARKYGVTKLTIHNVVKRKTWAWVV